MARALHAAIVLVLGVVSCSNRIEGAEGPPGAQGPVGPAGVDDPGAAQDGARLKRVHVVDMASDGAMFRRGWAWFDTARKERCSPLLAADASTRCLPSMIGSFAAFSDASCAKPVRAARDDFGEFSCLPYADVSDDGKTSRPAPLTGSTKASVWTRDASSSCAIFDASTSILTLGDEVSPDAFVRMQMIEEVEP